LLYKHREINLMSDVTSWTSWSYRIATGMVVWFTTTCAISAYHHCSCEFKSRSGEVYSMQHYVINFVS